MSGIKIGFGSNICRAVVRDAAGRVVEERSQANMVLTQGRANIFGNGFFDSGSITHACALGGAAQVITAGTTGLDSEEARVMCQDRYMAPSGQSETVVADFGAGMVAGKTLHTWGFSHSTSAGANINTAGVFEDSGGNPSPLVVPVGGTVQLAYVFSVTGQFEGANILTVGGMSEQASWVVYPLQLSRLLAGAIGGWKLLLAPVGDGGVVVSADGLYGAKIELNALAFPEYASMRGFVIFVVSGSNMPAYQGGWDGNYTYTVSPGDVITSEPLIVSW